MNPECVDEDLKTLHMLSSVDDDFFVLFYFEYTIYIIIYHIEQFYILTSVKCSRSEHYPEFLGEQYINADG